MGSTKDAPLVLITGASGFIGIAVAADLARDHRVVGLDVKRPGRGWKGAGFVPCDLTEDEGVRDALRRVREAHGSHLASTIHLAAWYDFSGEPSPLYDALTVKGTARLLRGLREGFEVEQLVFSSSLLVMEPVEGTGQVLTEASPTRAEWDYPRSKLQAEAVIERERGDVPVVILRIAGVYDDEGHSIPICQQIARIHEKELESYLFPGNADHGQSFLHLEDLVACVRRVVERRGELGEVELFLVGEPDTYSYAQLQDRIGDLLHGTQWPTIRIPAAVAKAGAWVKDKLGGEEETFIKPWMVDLADAHYPVSIERAQRRLGWEPRRRLLDSLSSICAGLARDPAGWYEANGLPVPDSVKDAGRGD